MLVKDLIKLLEELLKEHEPMKEVMGEAVILMDVYEYCGDHKFVYTGVDHDIILSYTPDGVYPVLAAKESTWRLPAPKEE